MSKFSDAAVTIRKAAVKYEQMVALASLLDEVGSLEQLASESKKSAEAAKVEAAKAQLEATNAQGKLDDTIAHAKQIGEDADLQAAAVVRAAEERAAAIEKAGQDKAAAMIANAEIEAQSVRAGAAMAIDEAKGRVDAYQAEVAMLAKQIDAGRAELERIEKAVTDSKKKIAALLG